MQIIDDAKLLQPVRIIDDGELLVLIRAFMARTGMKPTRFGRGAMGEASLIASLDGGRSLSLRNVNRVLGYMADYDATDHSGDLPEADDEDDDKTGAQAVAA